MAVWRRAACALLACLVIAACTPAPMPSPAPSVPSTPARAPTPSLTCTGTGPSPSPFPCDTTTREAEQRALEEQAKAVYARYWKEYTRLLESGGATEATPELKATVAEPALGDVVALLVYQADHKLRPSPFKVGLTLGIRPSPITEGAEVSLVACEDTRGSVFKDPTGESGGNGVLVVQLAGMKRIDGSMRVFYNEIGPSTCPVT